MSETFIPADEELAFNFEEKLSKHPFNNKENFVELYNSGLINRKDPRVSELVDEMIAAYRGIEKRADGVTFLDSGEISADDLIARAEAYSMLLRLQRIVKAAANAGEVRDGTHIAITATNLAVVVERDQNGELQSNAISSEKLPKVSEEAFGFAARLLGLTELKRDTPFEATRILGVSSDPVVKALEAVS